MFINNKKLALIYRAILVVVSAIGVYLLTGFYQNNKPFDIIIYYTGISNLICFIVSILSFIDTYNNNDKKIITPAIKGIVVMMITVTLLIYHFLLLPNSLRDKGLIGTWTLKNIITHYITPILVILDWVLFDEKGKYRKHEPLIWLIIPYTYLFYSIIRAQMFGIIDGTDSRYPYFFIDIDALGILGVLKYVFIITIAFVILGYIIYFIDKYFNNRMKKEG